jgi:hypothetical protein
MAEFAFYSVIDESFNKIQQLIPQFSIPTTELTAPILLLAAAVIIFLGVVGEAFFKKKQEFQTLHFYLCWE